MNEVEQIARELCVFKGIDPDGVGYAMSDKIKSELGSTYPLWKYQAREVNFIIDQMVDRTMV